MENETILIVGGSGFLGTLLKKYLIKKEYNVLILSRNKNANSIYWNPYSKEFPIEILSKIDHIINLSGASITKRWTEDYKKELNKSRIIPTKYLKEILRNNTHKVKSFINASGISIYGDRGDAILTEMDKPGYGFLEKLCVQWEAEANKIANLGIRTSLLRISPVVHKENEFIKSQLKLARFNLLTKIGDGNQYIPWVHHEDFCRIILFILNNKNISGALNISSPNAIQQKEINTIFEKVINKKQIFPPIPTQVIKWTMGEKSKLLTDSILAVPQVLLNNGFEFKFKTFDNALQNVLKE